MRLRFWSAFPGRGGANRRGGGRRAAAARGAATRLPGAERLERREVLTVGVLQPIAPLAVSPYPAAATDVQLAGRFTISDVAGTVVKVETNVPQPNSRFFVELFDTVAAAPVRTTPQTTQRFLAYVDDGSFDRSIIHRSVPGFVIQGGGYSAPTAAANQPGGSPAAIPSKGTIADEVGNPNQRGTLAMAKSAPADGPTTPNSATSQWFVNLVDNPGLDAEFSAFGRVLGNGMAVVDALAAVPRFDAAGYFQNPALTDLPLRSVPAEGVIGPENFVTVVDAGRATTDQLLGFTATPADADLVRAQVVGDRLVLSRAGGRDGTTTVTVRATAAFDPTDFVEFSFAVTVPPLPPPPAVTIEAAGAISLGYDAARRLVTNGGLVSFGGNPVLFDTSDTATWRAVAAEVVNGVNSLVWRHSSGFLHFWRMDASWNHVSSDGWVGSTNPEYFTAETTFGVDFNGDGFLGPRSITLESAGTVALTYGSAGNLRANGKLILFGGNTVNYFTTAAGGWTAVAADVVGGVNTLVLRHSSGHLHFWRMSSTWRQVSGDGWVNSTNPEYFTAETTFGTDFNGDGFIGSRSTTLESAGAVALTYGSAGNLRANGKLIVFGGNALNYLATAAGGWTAVAADVVDGVNTLVLRHSSGHLHFWRMSSTWRQVSGDGWVAPGSAAFIAAESTFGVDLDGNGTVGG